jgi:glycosyltransferase involved in cell wall biosynthesis
MRFSLMVPESNLITNHGYGVATHGFVRALVELGHHVGLNDITADVEIAFTQPTNWNWSSPDSYKIGYTPWESTRLPAGWADIMQTADEIWTTSPWCKRIFEKAGLEDVRVFQHGVDTTGDLGWTRVRRRPTENRPFRFLHMGEPAPRKGGQLTHDVFREIFGDSEDVQLTIKAHGYNTVRGPKANNVKLITEELEPFQLIDLIHRHDALIYPSYGEGFGLIPLQAMVTGMPVVCTSAWAPYNHLLLPELRLPSKLVPSPWDFHTGNMYEPDRHALSATMLALADPDTYANFSARAYANSFAVEREHDWQTLTLNAFNHIFEKFEAA